MGKALLCLGAILLACYSSNSAEIGDPTKRLGQLNAYYVYDRQTPHTPRQIYATAQSVIRDTANFRPKVVILVHDHGQSQNSLFDNLIKFAYFNNKDVEEGDVTIIVVNWSVVANQPFASAVSELPSVAANIQELIRLLVLYRRASLANLHMVGFGLGAHIVALTSRRLNGGVARITGLDPSNLQGLSREYLRPSDALYVEVIHTNGDGIGMGEPLGDVDFFPNGGNQQPRCNDNECHHQRAYELFANSMYDDSLVGKWCPPNVDMSAANCQGYSLLMGKNTLVKYGSGSFFVEYV